MCAPAGAQRRLIESLREGHSISTPLRELPLDERIRLVEDIWDSIAEDQTKLPVPDSHKRELDARLKAFELDGDFGENADVLIERIRKAL